jgi:hypothetical protein
MHPSSHQTSDPTEVLLAEWREWKKQQRLQPKQTRQMLDKYDHVLSDYGKSEVKQGFIEARQGKLSAAERVLAKHLIADRQSPDRVWMLTIMDWHGDATTADQLQELLNGDLHQIYTLTRDSDNLINFIALRSIVKKYPNSRFVQGCRQYEDLTGRSYFEDFGNELKPIQYLEQLERKTPAQKVADWQNWLNRYPDHPGADDATDHLARSLLADDDAMGATRQWIKLMTQPIGDGDARFRGYPRVKIMLDVGLTIPQLQELLEDSESASIAPLLRYAIAVHYARNQNYDRALQMSAGLDLNRMPHQVLSRYSWQSTTHTYPTRFHEGYLKDLLQQKQKMQAMLVEQRQRWQQLLQWQQENTPESGYKIASSWADSQGWKNGYLPVWEGYRRSDLPTSYNFAPERPQKIQERFSWDYPYGSDECRRTWVCDLSRRGETAVRKAYQEANSNAIALSLYQQLLGDATTSVKIREKILYMVGSTLFWQQSRFTAGETQRIHPPAGVTATLLKQLPKESAGGDWNSSDRSSRYDVTGDYQRAIDRIINQMQQQFPNSRYIDDLLIDNYFISWQPRYLEQIVKQYPKGDRADEARFLLSNSAKQEL